jgi:hypothetical protein
VAVFKRARRPENGKMRLASLAAVGYEMDVSYRGMVKNGVVLLPPEAKLPEGTAVEVIPEQLTPEQDSFLAAVMKVRKPRAHWPKDYARNIDSYLYGAPKRP